jgi:hypothetical protein
MSAVNLNPMFEVGDKILELLGVDKNRLITKCVITLDWANGCPPVMEITEHATGPNGEPKITADGDFEEIKRKFKVVPHDSTVITRTPSPPIGLPSLLSIKAFSVGPPIEMDFVATVKTDRKDRDTDILDPKGIAISPDFKFTSGVKEIPLPSGATAIVQLRRPNRTQPLSNEELKRVAAANPPPDEWFAEGVDDSPKETYIGLDGGVK